MKKELVVATNNPHKRKEISEILAPFGVVVVTASELGLGEVEETGATFEANAILKAEAGFALTGRFCLADDSGLTVTWLDGAPGVKSARYAGEDATDAANNAELIQALRGVPDEDRGAAFVCAMALVGPADAAHRVDRIGRNGDARQAPWKLAPTSVSGAAAIVVTGRVAGRIIDQASGAGGFGYDPHFFYPPAGCTFAELPAGEKHAVSHRGQALRALNAVFERLFSPTSAGT